MDIYREVEKITKEMVAIPSVNGTSGEKDIGVYIENYLRSIPYFEEHPDQVIVKLLKDDVIGRRNVFALLKGTKGTSNRTIILHGHTDTVGVEDFGILKEYAFDPDRLLQELPKVPLPEDVRKDLESGDYMFGRGCCDMQSGDAVYMAVARDLSTHLEDLDGNLLLSFNPVEENMHTGMIEAVDFLIEQREKNGLNYLMAINNDYTCPLYVGDTHQYIYTGTVGKLLPCFYILGKNSHVGQCFEGFDASMVAAELVKQINLNTLFCDAYDNEYSLPPSVLKMTDLKDFYNVQTAQEAFVYFNYFVHNASVEEIVDKLTTSARTALIKVEETIEKESKNYYALAGMHYERLSYRPMVYTYAQVYAMAKANYEGDIDAMLDAYTESLQTAGTDSRDIAMLVTKKVTSYAKVKSPAIVLFFAPPYCPHNTLKYECPEENPCLSELTELITEFGEEENLDYKILHFFPSLSDSSYLKVDDAPASRKLLMENFVKKDRLYPVDFEKIADLNIFAINFGTYGKDAHQWTERVYKPYTFGTLPKLVEKAIYRFLG